MNESPAFSSFLPWTAVLSPLPSMHTRTMCMFSHSHFTPETTHLDIWYINTHQHPIGKYNFSISLKLKPDFKFLRNSSLNKKACTYKICIQLRFVTLIELFFNKLIFKKTTGKIFRVGHRFYLSLLLRMALESIQPPSNGNWSKAAEAWSWSVTFTWCQG